MSMTSTYRRYVITKTPNGFVVTPPIRRDQDKPYLYTSQAAAEYDIDAFLAMLRHGLSL